MTNAEFVTSLNPDQSAALAVWRDEIVASMTAQHADAVAAVNADRTALKAANDKLTLDLATANTSLSTALATIEQGKQLILAGAHDQLVAMATEAAKTDKQKEVEAAQAELAAVQAKLAALQAGT